MGRIASFEEMVDKRKRGYEVIDGTVYDPDYVPTEEELNDPEEQELFKEHLRKMGCLPPDMWDAEDFRNYYEIKKREVGKKKAWEMIMDRINEIRNDEPIEDEYGFCWAKTDWGDFGGEIRRDLF